MRTRLVAMHGQSPRTGRRMGGICIDVVLKQGLRKDEMVVIKYRNKRRTANTLQCVTHCTANNVKPSDV